MLAAQAQLSFGNLEVLGAHGKMVGAQACHVPHVRAPRRLPSHAQPAHPRTRSPTSAAGLDGKHCVFGQVIDGYEVVKVPEY